MPRVDFRGTGRQQRTSFARQVAPLGGKKGKGIMDVLGKIAKETKILSKGAKLIPVIGTPASAALGSLGLGKGKGKGKGRGAKKGKGFLSGLLGGLAGAIPGVGLIAGPAVSSLTESIGLGKRGGRQAPVGSFRPDMPRTIHPRGPFRPAAGSGTM